MARGKQPKPKAKFGSDNSTSDGSLSYHADSGGVINSAAAPPPPPPQYDDEEAPAAPKSAGRGGKPVPVPSKSIKKIVTKESIPPPPPPGGDEEDPDDEDERKYMTSDELKHSRVGEKSEPISSGARSSEKLVNHKSSEKLGRSGKIDAMEITYKTEASAWPGDFDRFSPMDRSRTGTSLAFIPPAAGNAPPEPRPSMSGSMRHRPGQRKHKRGKSVFNGELGENSNANKRYWMLLGVIISVFSVAFMILEFNRQDWEVGKVGSENVVVGPPGRLVLAEYGGKGTLRFRDNYEIYRLFSPTFLHSGVLHLLISVILFIVTASAVEQHFGHFRFVAVYLLSSATGILSSMLFVPYLECIGLTIPTFGMIGALVADFIQNRRKLRCGTGGHLVILSVCAMVGIVVGFLPFFVDNYAHLGAFIGGFMVGLAALIDPTPDVDGDGKFVRPRYQFPLRIFGITWYILLLIALVVPVAVDVTWAPIGLQKAACIPTSVWECDLPKYFIQN